MVRPKKHLGQHFLRDENIARKIVGCLNPGIPLTLEIGPGTGVLTKYLLGRDGIGERPGKPGAWFMEVDTEAAEFLFRTYPEIAGRLIIADFLRYDLAGFPPGGREPLPEFTVIGNFPYNISTEILFKVLENRRRVPEVVGMFQKEVAERIASPPGSRTYGITSVLLQAFYDIEYLFTVSESVFYPPPKVKSAVIRLLRNGKESLGCDEKLFTAVVRAAFNQRRKKLGNALRTLTGSPLLSELLDKRAEQLSVEDFVRLTREITALTFRT